MTTKEIDTVSEARAWIGSLAAYNAGRLIGAWVDLDGKDADEVAEEAREAMRGQRDTWPAGMGEAEAFDELWVMDHEGIAGLVSGECNISEAVEAAAVMAEIDEGEREPFRAYVENLGPSNIDRDSVADGFHEAYSGEWDSIADYAEQLMDDTGALNEVPESLRGYIDFESYGRDLVLGGDYWTAPASPGVYVFRNY